MSVSPAGTLSSEHDLLPEVLSRLAAGDTSARLPRNSLIPEDIVQRLNGILEGVERRLRLAERGEPESSRDPNREILRALASLERGDFSARLGAGTVDPALA